MSKTHLHVKKNRFIAIAPSHEQQNSIFTILEPYKKQIEALAHTKWVFPLDYHITVGYMESVDEDDISALENAMISSLPMLSSFQVINTGVQFLGQALTLLLGPNDTFQTLYQTVLQQVQVTTEDKYPFETKGRFLPHLTLAKIDRSDAHHLETRESILEQLSGLYDHYEFDTDRLCLMQSKNIDVIGKSRYETLLEYPLNPAQCAG